MRAGGVRDARPCPLDRRNAALRQDHRRPRARPPVRAAAVLRRHADVGAPGLRLGWSDYPATKWEAMSIEERQQIAPEEALELSDPLGARPDARGRRARVAPLAL